LLEDDHDVHVAVFSALFTEQRFDTPSAVHPEAEACDSQRVHDREHFLGKHSKVLLAGPMSPDIDDSASATTSQPWKR
jgi:hypothetical protein